MAGSRWQLLLRWSPDSEIATYHGSVCQRELWHPQTAGSRTADAIHYGLGDGSLQRHDFITYLCWCASLEIADGMRALMLSCSQQQYVVILIYDIDI